MDIGDPDVQEELDAMTNAPKQSIFGSNRFGSKYLAFISNEFLA